MTGKGLYDVKTLWLPEDRFTCHPENVREAMDCMKDFVNSLHESDKLMLHFLLLDGIARDEIARKEGDICE